MRSPSLEISGPEHRRDSVVVVVAVALMCIAYALLVDGGTRFHYDHDVFLDAHAYQRTGMSYHDAYLQAFDDRGVAISEIRAVRQPLPFLVWRWIPVDLLWPTYVVLVTAITAVMTRLTRYALAALPVAAYLLLAGRIPSTTVVEQWLLVELWTVLPLALSVSALRRDQHGRAAGWAAVAFLIRETTVLYLLGAAALAMWRGSTRTRLTWVVGISVAFSGYAAHAVLVADKLAEHGDEAEVFGTGDAPRTLWEMAAWMVPGPPVIGGLIFALAVWRIFVYRHDLLALLGVFAVLGGGLFVARPYWGFLFIPFGLLLVGEQAGDVLRGLRNQVPEAEDAEIH